jgi:uncharacterized membrane protein
MTTIEKSIDVNVPVRTAYDQWTRFESFPEFMAGVDQIVQIGATTTRWRTTIGGVTREFDAQITAQHPDELVAWNTVEGMAHGGMVSFHPVGPTTTRVELVMRYEPGTFTEKAGTALGLVDSRIGGDLRRFKEFIESRGRATGAWRVDVAPPTTPIPAQEPETESVLGDMPNLRTQP